MDLQRERPRANMYCAFNLLRIRNIGRFPRESAWNAFSAGILLSIFHVFSDNMPRRPDRLNCSSGGTRDPAFGVTSSWQDLLHWKQLPHLRDDRLQRPIDPLLELVQILRFEVKLLLPDIWQRHGDMLRAVLQVWHISEFICMYHNGFTTQHGS